MVTWVGDHCGYADEEEAGEYSHSDLWLLNCSEEKKEDIVAWITNWVRDHYR